MNNAGQSAVFDNFDLTIDDSVTLRLCLIKKIVAEIIIIKRFCWEFGFPNLKLHDSLKLSNMIIQ